MDYLKILEHSFDVDKEEMECPPGSRLEFLSESIFDFTTYDSEMAELFATKAVEVCAAINDRKTFEYIEDQDNYRWFLVMCNMPFFASRLEWGTSIRGAWWGAMPGKKIEFQSCGLYIADNQCTDVMSFEVEEWRNFIAAVIEFASAEGRDG